MIDFSISAALPDGTKETAHRCAPAHGAVQDFVARLVRLKSKLGDWNRTSKLGVSLPLVLIDDDHFLGKNNDWKRKLRESLEHRFESINGNPPRLPIVTAAAIGSGNMLMKDPDLLRDWQKIARDLKAVEMELPGIYEAAHRKDGDIPVLAVCGISDIVGFKRHPDWTKFACKTAASLARALLDQKPIPPLPKHPKQMQDNREHIEELESVIEIANKINAHLGTTLSSLLNCKKAIKPLYEDFSKVREVVVKTLAQIEHGVNVDFRPLKEMSSNGELNKRCLKFREIVIPADEISALFSRLKASNLKPRMHFALSQIRSNYSSLNSCIQTNNTLCDRYIHLEDPKRTFCYYGIPDLSLRSRVTITEYPDNFESLYLSLERLIYCCWLLIQDIDEYLSYLLEEIEKEYSNLSTLKSITKAPPSVIRIDLKRISQDELMPSSEQWDNFLKEFK
jgi:hypothetical protein